VADVTGDSTAGSFVLGDVHFNQNQSFLVLQAVSLTGDIDTSNATPDVFSVGVAVTGLTDSGSLAAAFVPGVQSLMNSEVGTWRQRMGVIDKTSKGGISAWARTFSDSGTVSPGHIANNFGQGGDLAFDQNNSGQELGVDFGIADGLSVGLLVGKARASQELNNVGVGKNTISGDTRGIYGTWLASSGFYLDASYRWMNFDAKLDSAAGQSRASGKAGTFNVELGKDFSFSNGFKLEPQIQYTRTKVDQVDTLSGALAGFTPEGGTSSRARVGVLISKDFGTSGNTVWTPYVAVSGVREFGGNSAFTIDGNFSGATNTKGTSALVEGGLAMHTGNLSVFGGLNWQDGGALQSVIGGQIGVRYTW
jgi:outer membrane autotransporter protein